MLSLPLYGLLIGLPVGGVNGGRALDLDVPRLAESLLLDSEPEPEDAGEGAPPVLGGGVGDQHAGGGLLTIDVPVQLGSRYGVVGAAVGGYQVALLVPGEGAGDNGSLVWQV